jgi:hypothetical protein
MTKHPPMYTSHFSSRPSINSTALVNTSRSRMTLRISQTIIFFLPVLVHGDYSWIVSCAKKGTPSDWMADQPIEGSTSEALVTCMVNHVMTSPYTSEQLQLVPSVETWCLPEDFLSPNKTCASVRFDTFAPLRYCIEEESFPEISSGTPYAEGFNNSSSPLAGTPFYLSSRLVNSMCALLDGIHRERGKRCLVNACRQASNAPSLAPSWQPSILPSKAPSVYPSHHPTTKPSREPSAEPTREASESPSAFPSKETESPSAQPSLQPSWFPTPSPSIPISLGSGRFLQVKTSLRVLLDGAEDLEDPLLGSTITALERALSDVVRSIQGFQKLEIDSATRAPVPENAPVLVEFHILALRRCRYNQCNDPFIATAISQEFRNAFNTAVQDGSLQILIKRQGSRHNITGFFYVSPRANSSNLMSSDALVIDYEEKTSNAEAELPWCLVHLVGAVMFAMVMFL